MKTLHTAYRVTDLETSLDFYTALGYREVSRVDIGNGATLTMLKFPDEDVVTLEIVHRPDPWPSSQTRPPTRSSNPASALTRRPRTHR